MIVGFSTPAEVTPLSEAVLSRLRISLKDRYLVERELGEGGAATVFLARDIKHDRNVAIKVFKPELAETLGVDRFSREIRVAANLNHPHILTVLDSGTADGLLYYVMPFADGESLRARIAREGGLPIADVVRIMREVADALAAAHKAGVVHRDIKPDNVLLSGRHALVADFGVAKAISESTGKGNVTTIGVALGTPAYMAPEQAAADPHVDHRADIYALGILGYEMLVGEPPFVRRSPHEVLAAHVTEPAPPVSNRRQSVPPALEAIIAKCLAKAPGDRYQAATDVEAELERVMTPTAGMSPATGLQRTSATRVPFRNSKLGRFAIFAVSILASVLATKFASKMLGGSAKTDRNVVAVFPFEYSGTPDLAYLREGIVNVLETNLTGEAGPRAVASQTVIAQWKRKGGAEHGLTEPEAGAIAEELGAGQIMRGSIVAAGKDLVISASIVTTGGGGRPIQAQVKGSADSIAYLATQLAGQLLSLRVGEGAERLHSLQLVAPTALRQYLIGQQALRDSRFGDAFVAFSAALAQDSTFALAGMGLGLAQDWSLTNVGTADGFGMAFRHRDRLGARDLLLLEMFLPARFAARALSIRETMEVRERLVQQIPDRPEGWYIIGDQYFHRGAAMGLGGDEATRRAVFAFQKFIALDPGVTYVKRHIAESLIPAEGIARAVQVANSLGVLSPHLSIAARVRAGDSLDFGRIRAEVDQLAPDDLTMVVVFTAGTPVSDSVLARVLNRSTDVLQRTNLTVFARAMMAMEGRPSAARAFSARLAQLAPAPAATRPASMVYDAVFSSLDTIAGTEAMAVVQRDLSAITESAPRATVAVRHPFFLAGLWASFRSDSTALTAALQRLGAMAVRKEFPDEARLAQLNADALRLLAPRGTDRALVERVDSAMNDGPAVGSPEMRTAMNLIVARAWERLGDVKRAAAAAQRNDNIEPGSILDGTAAARERGRLALAAGDTAGAERAWRLYLTRRGMAEPSQRKLDDEIRAKLAEIEKKKR